MRREDFEIMAPVGSRESFAAALQAGADSIYFGIEHLNMRAHSASAFTINDLKEMADTCREHGVKSYLTVNTIIYGEDLPLMREILDAAKDAHISAVIASDIAVMTYARQIGVEVHLSTQLNISNIEALRFYAQFADVVVLARELKLSQIRTIIEGIKKEQIKGPSGELVRIEIFAHGALCIGVSGKCGMSLAAYNHSANRGQCFQLCRRTYRVTDTETGFEMDIDNQYIMSPKDICTIRVIDQLVEAGVSVFKLEGRGRSEAYVSTVTSVYKEAVTCCAKGEWAPEKVHAWESELMRVFNRQFWHGGYYLGEEWETWSGCSNSLALEQRHHLGKVLRWYPKVKVAEIRLEAHPLSAGDKIEITGCTTGIVRLTVPEVRCDDENGVTRIVETAPKGARALVALDTKVRHGDKVYLVTRRKLK